MPASSIQAGRSRRIGAASSSRSIPPTRRAVTRSTCRCATARIRSTSWPTVRSAKSGSSTVCNATGNLDLRYVASRRWTLQAGVDQYGRDSLPDRTHPYATVVANPTNDWALQSEIVGGGLTRGALRFEPSVDLHVEGEYIHFADDSAPVLTLPGRSSQWSLTGFLRPRTASGFFFFDGRIEQVRSGGSALTRTRLDASIQTEEIRLLPYVRTEAGGALKAREFAGISTFVLPRQN